MCAVIGSSAHGVVLRQLPLPPSLSRVSLLDQKTVLRVIAGKSNQLGAVRRASLGQVCDRGLH